MFKSELLKGEMVAKKIKAEYLADKIGINITTFYRKLGGESEFNRQEMNIIKNILHLNKDEMDAIFLANYLRKRKLRRKSTPQSTTEIQQQAGGDNIKMPMIIFNEDTAMTTEEIKDVANTVLKAIKEKLPKEYHKERIICEILSEAKDMLSFKVLEL